ncbi:hypothetical protein [Nonomuraea sp. NPDC048916]|uniref:hypothetical protein n=1 Tax=Nonomuraea sp. NPDC048916 TaxID=3154232 RepID=UPI00340251B4
MWSYPELADALGLAYREVPDTGPGAMAWLNGQVRGGALEYQSADLEQVLGRPPESMLSRLRASAV